MGDTRFRVWFGDRGGEPRIELARDRGDRGRRRRWTRSGKRASAHGDVPRRAAAAGSTGPATLAAPFSRVRVELDIGDGRFVPLIDGPLVSVDAALDSQPGRSTATFVVRDDSAFLNRDEEVETSSENKRDSEIADELFAPLRADRRHPHRRRPRPRPETTMRRGTVLSSCASWRAPTTAMPTCCRATSRARASAAFSPIPTAAASLPPLVLIGDDRNLANATHHRRPRRRRSARTAHVLRVSDQGVVTFETSAADLGSDARPAGGARRT